MNLKIPLKLPKIRLPSQQKIDEIFRETCLVAGFVMFGRGLWLIWPPLMWLICGVLLMFSYFGFSKGVRR